MFREFPSGQQGKLEGMALGALPIWDKVALLGSPPTTSVPPPRFDVAPDVNV